MSSHSVETGPADSGGMQHPPAGTQPHREEPSRPVPRGRLRGSGLEQREPTRHVWSRCLQRLLPRAPSKPVPQVPAALLCWQRRGCRREGTGRLTWGVGFPLWPPCGALLKGLPFWTSSQAGASHPPLCSQASLGRCPGLGDQAQPLPLELQIPCMRKGPGWPGPSESLPCVLCSWREEPGGREPQSNSETQSGGRDADTGKCPGTATPSDTHGKDE